MANLMFLLMPANKLVYALNSLHKVLNTSFVRWSTVSFNELVTFLFCNSSASLLCLLSTLPLPFTPNVCEGKCHTSLTSVHTSLDRCLFPLQPVFLKANVTFFSTSTSLFMPSLKTTHSLYNPYFCRLIQGLFPGSRAYPHDTPRSVSFVSSALKSSRCWWS